jgi:hypothetical protein
VTVLTASALASDPAGCDLLREVLGTSPRERLLTSSFVRAGAGFVTSTVLLVTALVALSL